MKLLLRPINLDESYEEYGKLYLPRSYDNLTRTNGSPVYEDHILDTLNNSKGLYIHEKYSDLFSGIVLFHDFPEDFKAYFKNTYSNTLMMQVYNPLKNITGPKSIEVVTLNHFLEGKVYSNLLLYGIYKISKNIGEDSQKYVSEVLRRSDERDVDFSLVSREELKNIDLLVCLAKTCDIDSNNKNFLEEANDEKEQFSFRGKKTRNSLERIFFDIPNLSKRIEEDKNFKIKGEKIFDNNFAQTILSVTKYNILEYFKRFDIIETLVENKGLGSKVNTSNYSDYQILLDKLKERNPELFSERANLKKVMGI
ncbi:MAG: hypothetical protein PF569_05855 [Candidatus Woesearchaeota archaeon]|jgi:hypothetical protein|nr:hypothetical protein [Candidatus Woesearchaeota archaeon]